MISTCAEVFRRGRRELTKPSQARFPRQLSQRESQVPLFPVGAVGEADSLIPDTRWTTGRNPPRFPGVKSPAVHGFDYLL